MNFRRGDIVVCIATEAPCCGDTTLRAGALPQPKLRRFYRVEKAGAATCNACGTTTAAFIPTEFPDPEWAWPQMIFKRVEPGTEDIFKLAKAHA